MHYCSGYGGMSLGTAWAEPLDTVRLLPAQATPPAVGEHGVFNVAIGSQQTLVGSPFMLAFNNEEPVSSGYRTR